MQVKKLDIIKTILAIFLILFIIISPCIYFCSHCKRFPYYAEEGYYFAAVQIGSGRNIEQYFGVITKEDYEQWCDGKKGIITVYNARKNGRCWKINSLQVTAITNYGNEPEWLPLNF